MTGCLAGDSTFTRSYIVFVSAHLCVSFTALETISCEPPTGGQMCPPYSRRRCRFRLIISSQQSADLLPWHFSSSCHWRRHRSIISYHLENVPEWLALLYRREREREIISFPPLLAPTSGTCGFLSLALCFVSLVRLWALFSGKANISSSKCCGNLVTYHLQPATSPRLYFDATINNRFVWLQVVLADHSLSVLLPFLLLTSSRWRIHMPCVYCTRST